MLLVALGNPRQEQWIGERLNQLDVRVAAGVGALIDFLSNSIPRAPRWMRTIRCEWVFRLAREPRRLFARYVLGNPMFLVRLLLYAGRRGK
jgi:exopolysaccharide biosynthesis WecB/TagA/CpsF family protein